MPRRLSPPPSERYNIICPYCKVQNLQLLKDDYTNVQCPSCSENFRVFIATVRVKRGRKKKNQREYVIRTVTHSGEAVGEIEMKEPRYWGTSVPVSIP